MFIAFLLLLFAAAGAAALVSLLSLHRIGPTEVGLVTRRFSAQKLDDDNPIAFKGEAGYPSELLMPGLRFRLWPLYGVEKYPWVRIPAGQIGVVIAQVGQPLPTGAKSGVYKPSFGQFTGLETFLQEGGQKGVQRPVLAPGTTLPLHLIAFFVISRDRVFGRPVSEELQRQQLTPMSLGLSPADLEVVRIAKNSNSDSDGIGIVSTLEGDPLSSGDIASRLGREK